MDRHWDFIIVGGGSAGCALANRLSADPAVEVLLLDAGRPDNHPYTRVPVGQMGAFTRHDMNWQFVAEADPSLYGREQMWPAGKVLGGGSSINGMMFVRGHPQDYDGWAEDGCTGWSYNDVLPYFKRMENNIAGANDWRGSDGPVSVSPVRISHPLTDAFVQSAIDLGIKFNDDLNGETAEGVGYCQASQRNGWRHSTAQAYIRPIRERRNLTVTHHALVTCVSIEQGRAVGVEYRHNQLTHRVRARAGVVLSAGAMITPKLLMLSGIGDGDQLHNHGIPVIADIPGVGKNLQEHAVGPLTVRFKGIGTLTSELGVLSAVRYGLDFLLRGRGPLATCIGHAMALVRTDPELPRPDAQIIFAPFDFVLTDRGARPALEPVVTLGVGLCQAHSRGEIKLRSVDPEAAPLIQHRLLGDDRDLATLIAAAKLTRRIVQSRPLADFIEEETRPGPMVHTDLEWEAFLRANTGLMYHPCGTCRMGVDAQSVVDPNLKVRGIDGLWVADASVIPRIPAGNINATCIMIGEKASDLIADQHRLKGAL